MVDDDAPEYVQQIDLLLAGQTATNRLLRKLLFATRIVAIAAAVVITIWILWILWMVVALVSD